MFWREVFTRETDSSASSLSVDRRLWF